MTYLDRIVTFEKWLEANPLKAKAQLLYYKMLWHFNRAGWPEWLSATNLKLMASICISREGTFIDIRNQLLDCGLMIYRKGKKGVPNSYKLCDSNLLAFKNTAKTADIIRYRDAHQKQDKPYIPPPKWN